MTTKSKTPSDIRGAVRERYGKIAENFQVRMQASCDCSTTQSSCCAPEIESQLDTITRFYEDPDAFELPTEVTELSLGCGDPVTLASLKEGQTVLDLGAGGGIDCFLAAKKVGPTGKVIGVDMTPAMIERARSNQIKLEARNVEFRLGEIENLPVADDTVDVIISNCVINLSPDKHQVFREAYRVLRQGGKLAVSDIVTDGSLPDVIKNSLSAWAGCVAGAIDVKEYIAAMQDAGFIDVDVNASYWDQEMINEAIEQIAPDLKSQIKAVDRNGQAVLVVNNGADHALAEFDPQKAIFSAKITARKPK